MSTQTIQNTLKGTRIVHRRYTAEEWKNKTLRQGEIGILLSEKDENGNQDILQVRVGNRDNTPFTQGFLLGQSGADIETMRQFRTKTEFPNIGSEFTIYIAKDTNTIYRWDDNDIKYYECSSTNGSGSDWHEIQAIHGGSAEIIN